MTSFSLADALKLLWADEGRFPHVALLFAVAATVYALQFLVRGGTRRLASGAMFVAATVFVGVLGTQAGHRKADELLQRTDPWGREMLSGALHPAADLTQEFAVVIALFPALLLVGGLSRHGWKGPEAPK